MYTHKPRHFCVTVYKLPWYFCFAEVGYTTSANVFEQQVVYPTSTAGISCTGPEGSVPRDSLSECTFLDGSFRFFTVTTTNPVGVQCARKLL